MNRIDFSHAGGFPLETDTFDFLQKSLADPIKALSALGGDNYIISGMVETNGKVSDGWVVINGEILPFKGDFKQNTVIVAKTAQKVTFENGTKRDVYFTHQAMFGAGLESIPFASMPRIRDLQQQKKKADELNDRVEKLERGTLIPGMIMAWKGSVDNIPARWKLCAELKDKFILGAGGDFKVGDTGGERTHQLTVEEIPAHSHSVTTVNWHNNQTHWDFKRSFHLDHNAGAPILHGWPGTWDKSYYKTISTTNTTGGNQPHNNMPPYYALAYIEYMG